MSTKTIEIILKTLLDSFKQGRATVKNPSRRAEASCESCCTFVLSSFLPLSTLGPYLIRAISTIMVPITLPTACNAPAIGARELTFGARPGLCKQRKQREIWVGKLEHTCKELWLLYNSQINIIAYFQCPTG